MVRGKTYTFVIEGGSDPDRPANYHPFYITDDPEGGYEFMSKEKRRQVRVSEGTKFPCCAFLWKYFVTFFIFCCVSTSDAPAGSTLMWFCRNDIYYQGCFGSQTDNS